ncbi:head maturation protease, ClpP-related [Streptomyces rubiginosohelvolus]|uniref:head maturation protease, ClpP-related n=1 Tax=Streptomyces rubiginosohelvolus TaxID=67362 RepID=UPI00340C2E45
MPWIEAVARPDRLAARAQVRADAGRAWYEIRNAAADEAEVLIYDDIGGWFGATADVFVRELAAVTAPNLRVRINSPGGSVFEGIAIANAIRLHPANVTVQVDGIAASIASVIAMAGDRIVMMPQSQLMIHDAHGACLGNAGDMEEMARLLNLQSENLADVYAARAGGTREEWRARMRAESWYLAQEAVDAGLADEVITAGRPDAPAEEEPAMANSWDLSVFRYAGREEAPAPQPVAAAPAPTTELHGAHGPETLTFTAGSVLTDEMVALLRASIVPPTPATPETPVEPEHVTDPVDELPTPAPEAAEEPTEPVDDWADLTAHLTTPEPDPWAALTSHLIDPEASSRAATA